MSAAFVSSLGVVDWGAALVWRWAGAALLLLLSLAISLPSGTKHGVARRILSGISGVGGLLLLWWTIPRLETIPVEAGFWCLVILAIGSAVATISSRSPVYCAIWFAASLLGTAGLFLLQGAQFLGIATIAVYAGAIVVTFLFVLMLAQPEGHAFYDRISWGVGPSLLGAFTAVLFALVIAAAVTGTNPSVLADQQTLRGEVQRQLSSVVPVAQLRAVRFESLAGRNVARVTLAVPSDQRTTLDDHASQLARRCLPQIQARHPDWLIDEVLFDVQDVAATEHTASLGGLLFSRQLVAIQAAGAVLMAALVGAVAIVGRTGALEDVTQRPRNE
jgi:NADH-quinone oxidoreductase subunit J